MLKSRPLSVRISLKDLYVSGEAAVPVQSLNLRETERLICQYAEKYSNFLSTGN